MSEKKPEYSWHLTWSGRDDTPRTRAALEPCKTFHLWKDYVLKVVTYEEACQMIAAGELAQFADYWRIEPGQWGLISKTGYGNSQQWENLSLCFEDFLRGWDACEARVHMLMDWDEAIQHDKDRNKWFKVASRRYEFKRAKTEEGATYPYDTYCRQLNSLREYDHVESVVEREDRRGYVWYELRMKCTGPQFAETLWSMSCKFYWIFSFEASVNDPTVDERKPNKLPSYKRVRRDSI